VEGLHWYLLCPNADLTPATKEQRDQKENEAVVLDSSFFGRSIPPKISFFALTKDMEMLFKYACDSLREKYACASRKVVTQACKRLENAENQLSELGLAAAVHRRTSRSHAVYDDVRLS
jgi:hypothetical protein